MNSSVHYLTLEKINKITKIAPVETMCSNRILPPSNTTKKGNKNVSAIVLCRLPYRTWDICLKYTEEKVEELT